MRTKKTFLNALFSAISTLISSVLALVATRLVLVQFGSDYNGINSTITQFMSMLMILESGFSLATLVMLYKPFGENDFQTLSAILSKTAHEFKRIGLLVFISGSIGAAVYCLFIKTSIPYIVCFILFFLSVLATSFDFWTVYKYRLLFQVSQTEYKLYLIKSGQYILMYGSMIIGIIITNNIIIARTLFSLFSILGGVVVCITGKRSFPGIIYNAQYTSVSIKGTKDLFVSRISGLLYNSLTVLYMSTFVGTTFTSIYAVYNSVITIITNYLMALTTAPQNALGQVINQERQRLKQVLHEYEFMVLVLTSILLTTTTILIMPFVRMYTRNVTDVNYIQPQIAILLVLITALQMIHIPSGQCIELSGNFRVVKKCQLTTLVLLGVLSLIGAYLYGLIGLLLAKLITNVVLATIEITYTHTKLVERSVSAFLRIFAVNLLVSIILTVIGIGITYEKELNILAFVLLGFITILVTTILIAAANYLIFREESLVTFRRILSLIKRKSKTTSPTT